jgi:dihydropteroate synthase
MGVVNVTPDSFYDGGKHLSPDAAVLKALELAKSGAVVIDIGGESTRPGAEPVSEQEEMDRVLPVISRLKRESDVIISIDTRKSSVAREALKAGAHWINDVSAGRFDNKMAGIAAENRCPVVLMHSRKTPLDMQAGPYYSDVVREVKNELLESASLFIKSGVSPQNIILDPGIGFAKRPEDNLALLNKIEVLVETGYPVLVGASRKSFIGVLTGKTANDRLAGSLAAVAAAFTRKVKIFRVHDAAETADFLKVLDAIYHA